jgi:hypothetical protein
MNVSFLIAIASQYPDALDHLRGGDVKPQVSLLLDRSGSMAWGKKATACTWYGGAYAGGSTTLDKSDQMKASLIGCASPADGLLDRWADRIDFSVYDFGSGTSLRAPFGSTLDALESGVRAVPRSGSTYMTLGLRDTGRYFQTYFTAGNTLECRPSFIVMLSDGNPNGGGSVFDYECRAPVESRSVGATEPWRGSDYLYRHEDILCSVPGDQPIATYTIGFGDPGDFSPSNLQSIAASGGGDYYYASDVANLSVAFESIIGSIVDRSGLSFSPIAIQTGALFSRNVAYSASFRPAGQGPWRGTLKKHCVTPPVLASGKYDATTDTCMFVSPNGTSLLTNPEVMDLFTGLRSLDADIGGTGEVLLDQLGAQSAMPKAPYWSKRNVVTWRRGVSGYAKVAPSSWSSSDSFTNGCAHAKLVNHLHGYTYDADCATGAPKAFAEWPVADTVHASPVLLQYGACEKADGTPVEGACYVVTGGNDGLVHFTDAATGRETSALIPADLWTPGVASSALASIFDQPSSTFTHRFYVDGDARLFHHDENGDAIIQKSEIAYLVLGLGRGGRAYYSIPVSELPGGVLDTSRNPVHPITGGAAGDFRELRDTWAAPYLGLLRKGGGTRRVAAFGTGHVKDLDVAGSVAPPPVPVAVDLSKASTVNCKGSGHFADFNGLDKSKWCQAAWFPACNGKSGRPCYDGAGVPLDVATKPLTYNDGVSKAAAIRISFNDFDLEAGDVLRIEDGKGNLVKAYTGSSLDKGMYTDWVYGEHVVLRLVTNGKDSKNRGFSVKKVDWVPGAPIAAPAGAAGAGAGSSLTLADHQPSVFIVDLDRWNDRATHAFAATSPTDAILYRVTRDCTGSAAETCIDRTTDPDLDDLICPISAELSGYEEGGTLSALYFGDECAQIWKLWKDGDELRARKIVNLNGGSIGLDRDHRRMFRKVDLVLSACPQRPVMGLYFGTGDVQHPLANDQLSDTGITNGRDIAGVVWDFDGLPSDLTDRNLFDATGSNGIDPAKVLSSNAYGWFIALRDGERVLRDPLVFDQVAYFKTYEPTSAATECGGAAGVDRVYAVDSCTTRSVIDVDADGVRELSDREAWTGATDVGGGIFYYAPKDAPPIVSHADLSKEQKADLNRRKRRRPGLFLFRER